MTQVSYGFVTSIAPVEYFLIQVKSQLFSTNVYKCWVKWEKNLPLHILYCLDIVIVVNCWVSTAEYSHIVLKIKVYKFSIGIALKTS